MRYKDVFNITIGVALLLYVFLVLYPPENSVLRIILYTLFALSVIFLQLIKRGVPSKVPMKSRLRIFGAFMILGVIILLIGLV